MDLTGFKLTYDDEFNSFAWSPDGTLGYKTQFYFGGREIWTNGDQQYYSDPSVGVNPFALSNGALHITASPGTNPDGQPYNSGMITTEGSFAQQYGYFEARVQVAPGQALWTSVWLLPENKSWPPEIDLVEAFGAPNGANQGGVNSIWHNEISAGHTADQGSFVAVNGNTTTEYHTYGVDWEPDVITWYIDGKQSGQPVATPVGTDVPMYMLVTLEVGGWSGQPLGETGTMGLDYLRAYSKNPNATAVALQQISSPDGVDTTPYGATDAHGVIGGGTTPPPAGGSGSNTVTVRVSEDAWAGDAQFTVMVDGVQVGGTQTATASHAAGQWQNITLAGNFATTGAHTVDINFINDGWGGSLSTDRNLYVQSVTINGDTLPASGAQDFASNGMTVPDGAILAVNGNIHFTDPGTGSAGTGGTGGAGVLTVHVSEDAWNGDAQFTVLVDGQQVGGTQTVTASHAAGQWQDITISNSIAAGPHTVAINFINDGWGGTLATDRNMYVQSITINGEMIPGSSAQDTAANGNQAADPTAAVMDVNGTATFHSTGTGGTTGGTGGTVGPSTIVLHVSEDAWNGDAQFIVKVDGTQVGGIQTATASHAAHAVQDITFTGDFGAQGPGTIDVTFINDAWGGSAATDRNLYVNGVDVNGHAFPGTGAVDNAANGSTAPDAAVMAINGTVEFNINHTAPPAILG
ncbi:MAG TPA: carbohydrate-binding domain-containing protein [Alphaproteobacteria bacterium]|jgi:beta-glucanase (GH16 family)|nr:carbohydrate-binding domain-containing protein [Alphaproteobacteria bacterium]